MDLNRVGKEDKKLVAQDLKAEQANKTTQAQQNVADNAGSYDLDAAKQPEGKNGTAKKKDPDLRVHFLEGTPTAATKTPAT